MSETLSENRPVPLRRISQRQLETLQTCPRQFQHIFLDRLEPPIGSQQQESMAVGSRFHLLMQQRSLGLPVESLVDADPQIRQWWDEFLAATPELLVSQGGDLAFRQAEHERTLEMLGFLLVVRYDFILADDRAQIFDWKTYPRPRSPQHLEQHWQTRLYSYVLAETSDYEPDRISMTYWFVPGEDNCPQSYSFPYSQQQHDRNRGDLTRLLSQLHDWLSDYSSDRSFPTQQNLSGVCTLCPSGKCRYLSGGDTPPESLCDFSLEETDWSNLDLIPEIPI